MPRPGLLPQKQCKLHCEVWRLWSRGSEGSQIAARHLGLGFDSSASTFEISYNASVALEKSVWIRSIEELGCVGYIKHFCKHDITHSVPWTHSSNGRNLRMNNEKGKLLSPLKTKLGKLVQHEANYREHWRVMDASDFQLREINSADLLQEWKWFERKITRKCQNKQ